MTAESTALSLEDSRTITAKSRSNFSASFFFLSPEKRVAMERVYAFFRVIDDIVDEEPDPVLQKRGLDYWKAELALAYGGKSQVPLLKELKESVDRFQIPQEYFLKLIEGCEMDMVQTRVADLNQLIEYCYRVASMVGLVCMRIFEYESETSDQCAIDLGIALQLTNIIRDVGVDADKGRIYLPQEDLKKFGVKESDILAKRATPEFYALMEFEYRRAAEYYAKSAPEFAKDGHNKLLAARMMAKVYRKILEKVRKKGYPVLNERVKISLPEKALILFQSVVSYYL